MHRASQCRCQLPQSNALIDVPYTKHTSRQVDELLKSGANPDVVDRDSKTPAMLATDQGVLDLLRKAGAKMPVNA